MICKLTLLLLLISTIASGQHNQVDVIYLNDGSIIKGEILKTADKIAIETFCGNTLVYEKNQIKEISKEKYSPFHTLKEKGYYNYTSMGALIGSESDAKTTNFSFIMEHNYLFHKHFAVGVTTGIEWFNTSTMPIGLNLKLMLPASHQMAFYIGGTGGYAIPLEELVIEQFEVKETKGGWLANTELGVIFPFYVVFQISIHLFCLISTCYKF